MLSFVLWFRNQYIAGSTALSDRLVFRRGWSRNYKLFASIRGLPEWCSYTVHTIRKTHINTIHFHVLSHKHCETWDPLPAMLLVSTSTNFRPDKISSNRRRIKVVECTMIWKRSAWFRAYATVVNRHLFIPQNCFTQTTHQVLPSKGSTSTYFTCVIYRHFTD